MKFNFLLCLLSSLIISSFVKASVTLIPLCKLDKNVDDFPFVGIVQNINNSIAGSGTVIGDGSFVLTARHLVTHDGSQRGIVIDQSNFIFMIEENLFEVEKVYAHETSDIAILKIKGSFSKTAKLSFSTYFMKNDFYGVGFGKSSEKPLYNKIEWDMPYGSKRVYKNTITDHSIDVYISGSKVQIEKSLIFSLRKPSSLGKVNGAIKGEGMHGPGDSGGGVFIIEDDEFHVFGVISAIATNDSIKGIVADLSLAKDWISNIVPNAYASPKASIPKEQKLHLQLKGAFTPGVPFISDNKE